MEPDERILTARNHKFIAAKMNLHSRFGNVDPALVQLLNELTRKRGDARYVGGHVDVTPQRMDEMLGIVRSNIDLLSTTMPKRFPSSLESKS